MKFWNRDLTMTEAMEEPLTMDVTATCRTRSCHVYLEKILYVSLELIGKDSRVRMQSQDVG